MKIDKHCHFCKGLKGERLLFVIKDELVILDLECGLSYMAQAYHFSNEEVDSYLEFFYGGSDEK